MSPPPGVETWSEVRKQTPIGRRPKSRAGPAFNAVLLAGEEDEHARGPFSNRVTAAETKVKDDPEQAVRILTDPKGINMPKDIARQLIDDARNDIVGTLVTCETVFEEPGRIGGPRHYEDFSIIRGQKEQMG